MAKSGATVTSESVNYYLQSNPDFAKEWVSNHATREMIDKWRLKHEVNVDEEEDDVLGEMDRVRNRSFMTQRNSITSSMFKDYVDGKRMAHVATKKSITQLREMSERELFMELIRDIANELDVDALCFKILLNVSILTNSDRGSLFLSRGNKGARYLVSKLFDVTQESTLASSLHTEDNQIKVPYGKGIAGTVAESKEIINIIDAYKDPRFNKEIDKKTGYRTRCILCMPVLNYDGDVMGVAQIINKKTGETEFSEEDIQVFKNYLTFCGIGISNAQLFEMSVQEYKRNQMVLKLAKGIFEEQANLEKLIQKIMLEVQDLLKCEKCSVYLLDEEAGGGTDVKFSKVFDLYAKDKGTIHIPSVSKIASCKNTLVAEHVVKTRQELNISDIEADGRFGKGPFVDEDGFRTQCMLCLPIYDQNRQIIGITQLINKINKSSFNSSDINMFEAFSIFCGLGIHNCQMYENARKLLAKQTVALEVLSYHATSQAEETGKLSNAVIPTAKKLNLFGFDFNDIPLSDDETLQASVRMMLEMDVLQNFQVPYEVLCRFMASVKKNYRDVTYHNWRHAFNVAQTMFTILTTGGLGKILDDLEKYALIVACLCHDLDHRGTNNAFQAKSDSPLALLYSTSTMEHHHFDHCIMILTSKGNNIFGSLEGEDYRRALKLLESAILSTDLALYFKKRGQFQTLVDSGEKKFKDDSQREILRGMMMTACDVAAITKPWEIQREVAELVSAEFFEQGDLEKNMGDRPIAMLDRSKKEELPKMQVGFIDAICMPVYKLFADQWPGLSPMYEGCLNNRNNWLAMIEESNSAKRKANESAEKCDSKEDKIVAKKNQVSPTNVPVKRSKSKSCCLL